jgi:hypothetical protein
MLREADMDHGTSTTTSTRRASLEAEPTPPAAASEIEPLRRRIQALQAGASRRIRARLRERPVLALGVAVAAGFILGRAIRRL